MASESPSKLASIVWGMGDTVPLDTENTSMASNPGTDTYTCFPSGEKRRQPVTC